MGIIRIILALAVVLVHTGPVFGIHFIDSAIAVQSFFIISGFYISLVLTEKYNFPNSYKLFITNRLLRLFPTYIFIAFITLITGIVLYKTGSKIAFIDNLSEIDFFSKLYAGFINIIIIGQETTLFLGFNDTGSLQYTSNYHASNPPVFTFLLCPPAWSLSLELMFYILAPFILTRRLYVILALLFLSLSLRIFLYSNGFSNDPWSYRFFPTELFFFLAGNISYRLYAWFSRSDYHKNIGLYLLIFLLIVIFIFNYIPIHYYIKQSMYYIYFISAIPIIFHYTKNNSLDRSIGELSFPIYLSHIFILNYCIPVFNGALGFENLNSLLTVAFSILFSIVINYMLMDPIEAYRNKRIASQ